MFSQVWANHPAFLQSALDSGVVPIRGASRRCRTFCGGDSPWLRRLSGVTTHWMAGSLFSYMTWCKSSFFLARARCYLVRAMTTLARAILFSSAGTLEIAIYNWK